MTKALFIIALCSIATLFPTLFFTFIYACFSDENRGKAFLLIWCTLTFFKSCMPLTTKKESYLK